VQEERGLGDSETDQQRHRTEFDPAHTKHEQSENDGEAL
jgi:hypothetical protein